MKPEGTVTYRTFVVLNFRSIIWEPASKPWSVHHHYPDQMALNCVIRHFQTHLDSYPGLSWEMRERLLDQIEDKLFKTGDKMIEWQGKLTCIEMPSQTCHSSHVHQRQFCVAKLMRSTWQTSLQGWGSQLFTVFVGSCSDLAPCRTCTTCPSGELQNKRTKSQETYGFLHKSRVDKWLHFFRGNMRFSTLHRWVFPQFSWARIPNSGPWRRNYFCMISWKAKARKHGSLRS